MPAIKKPNQHFDATLYTGTGASLSVTNAGGFRPDLVWAKNRDAANYNVLTDSVRGVQKSIYSNTNDAQATGDGLTSFNSNGFSVDGVNANWNNSGYNFASWQWKAGGTAATNNDGFVASQVSLNSTAGFSVVTYTGNGSNSSVGHGLGVAPSVIIIKSSSTTNAWAVYHRSVGTGKYLILSSTNAADTDANYFSGVTSTLFSMTGSAPNMNFSGASFVAYCWAEIEGYSKFGSYTGNGSTDGPFVYTGFRPKFVLIKCSSGSGAGWFVYDTARSTYNLASVWLRANESSTEGGSSTDNPIDILSNGFKLRYSNTATNQSGQTFIYMAFAEAPFKFANGR
jgi:hypothetical protein